MKYVGMTEVYVLLHVLVLSVSCKLLYMTDYGALKKTMLHLVDNSIPAHKVLK